MLSTMLGALACSPPSPTAPTQAPTTTAMSTATAKSFVAPPTAEASSPTSVVASESSAAPSAISPNANQPPLISDEECVARGDRVVTRFIRPSPRHRMAAGEESETTTRVCLAPSDAGKTCSNGSDCLSNFCMCTGPLARPGPENDPALVKLDGSPATGRCHDQAGVASAQVPGGVWSTAATFIWQASSSTERAGDLTASTGETNERPRVSTRISWPSLRAPRS